MGLMEGGSGIHWLLALRFFLGWVVTLIITATLSAALFSAGAYAPCRQQSKQIMRYEDLLNDISMQLTVLVNRWVWAD